MPTDILFVGPSVIYGTPSSPRGARVAYHWTRGKGAKGDFPREHAEVAGHGVTDSVRHLPYTKPLELPFKTNICLDNKMIHGFVTAGTEVKHKQKRGDQLNDTT